MAKSQKSSFGAVKVANKSNKLIFFIIFAAMFSVFAGSLIFFSKVIQTETYWVLSQPVPQRAKVTPDMLTEVEVNKGGAPTPYSAGGIALTDVEVAQGAVFTRIPLSAGDILTTSNTTSGLSDIRVGLPDTWTVTTLEVPADNAAGGRITRGTYFDILVTDTQNGTTFFPYVNVLCLDTSVSLNNASSANAASSSEAKAGQTEIYYLGMPPAKIAELEALMAQDGIQVKLMLSPIQNNYNSPDLSAYMTENGDRLFRFNIEEQDLVDSGAGTNNTFDKLERDEFGRPTEVWPNGVPKSGDLTELGVGGTHTPYDSWLEWMAEYQNFIEAGSSLDPTEEGTPSGTSNETESDSESE